MEYRKWYLVIVVFALIFIFFGGSLAYWQWTTNTEQRTNVVFTVTQDFKCEVDGGGDITEEEKYLIPTDCTNADYAIQREIKVNPTLYTDISITMDLWLDIKSIGSGLKNSDNFKYALTTDPNSCTKGVVESGTFKGKNINSKVELFSYMGYNKTVTDTFYLYIWLDKAETNSNTMNQNFSLSLNGMCANSPMSDTYVVFNEDDTTLRIYKETNESQVDNDIDEYIASRLNNNIKTMEDLIISDEDKIRVELENTRYSSAEQLPWYEYRDSITKIVIEDEISPKSIAYWFRDLKNVTYMDLSNLDTSSVTNMSYMFNGMSSLTSLDLSSFDTSSVTDMGYMFNGMSSLTSLDLSSFDTSSVTDMGYMFNGMSSLTSLDLSSFDVTKVTNMEYMFFDCSSLTTLNLSNFNALNVINMGSMFRNMSSLTSLDLSSFDTSSVILMDSMFNGMSSLTTLDLSNFDTSNVIKIARMFNGMSSLTSLNISNFDTSNVTDMKYLFYKCHKLQTINVSSFDTSKVINMEYMFSDCYSLTTLDLSNFNTSNVTNMKCMFNYMRALTSLNISNFNTSNVTNMYGMFSDCVSLTTLDLSSFDTSKVINTEYMFYNVPSNLNIIVKDDIQKNWINNKFTDLTNVVVKN